MNTYYITKEQMAKLMAINDNTAKNKLLMEILWNQQLEERNLGKEVMDKISKSIKDVFKDKRKKQ